MEDAIKNKFESLKIDLALVLDKAESSIRRGYIEKIESLVEQKVERRFELELEVERAEKALNTKKQELASLIKELESISKGEAGFIEKEMSKIFNPQSKKEN